MPISPSSHKFYLRPQVADTVPTDRVASAATLGTGSGTATKIALGGSRYAWRFAGQREAAFSAVEIDTTQSATVYVMVAQLRLNVHATFGNQYLGIAQFAENASSGVGFRLSFERSAGVANVYGVQSTDGLLPAPINIFDGVQRTIVLRITGGSLGARKLEWWLSSGSGSAPDQALTTGSFTGNMGANSADTVSVNLPGEAEIEYENLSLFAGPSAEFDNATCRLLATDFDAALGGGGDTTAPTLSSPSATGGVLTCSGNVTTNEGNGTLYTVVTSSATTPSAAQVKLGQDNTGSAALRVVSQAVTATGAQTIASGAVTAGSRNMYSMHEDAAANQSAVAVHGQFTVTSGGDTTAPTLSSPTGTGGTLTGSGSVTTNEGNGTLWWKVDATATATDPGAGNEAAAGWTSQAVSATGAQTVSTFGALTAGTKYAHYLHPDAAGNRSAVVNSAGFTVSSSATYSASWTMGFVTNLTSGILQGAVPWSGFYSAYDSNAPGAVPSTPIAASGTLSSNTLNLSGIPFSGPLKLHLAIGSGASAAHYTLLLNAA